MWIDLRRGSRGTTFPLRERLPTRGLATDAHIQAALPIIAVAADIATQEVGYQVDELILARSAMHGREHDEIVNIIEQIIDRAAPGQPHWRKGQTHTWVWKLEDMAKAHKALIARLAEK